MFVDICVDVNANSGDDTAVGEGTDDEIISVESTMGGADCVSGEDVVCFISVVVGGLGCVVEVTSAAIVVGSIVC